MIIETILDIAGKLLGMKDKLSQARRDRRDRIADYFEHLSKTVEDVAGSLRAGQVPHGKCQQMASLAATMQDTIGDEIGAAQAIDYSARLTAAHDVEMLLAELSNVPDREKQLADLERAAGMFEAVAVSVRAAK